MCSTCNYQVFSTGWQASIWVGCKRSIPSRGLKGQRTGSVEASEADGGNGHEGRGVEHDGDAQQERQRCHRPSRIDGRLCAVIQGSPDAVRGNAAIPRERPQHPGTRSSKFTKLGPIFLGSWGYIPENIKHTE